MKKMGRTILGLGLLALTLNGCGQPSAQGESGDKGKDKIIIGFSQHRIAGSDWYKMLIEGAKAQAEKQGVTILVTDAGGDAVQQNSDIQNMMSRGAKGIVVNALDPRGIANTVNELDKEGIPLVAVNTRLSPELEKKSYCFVAEDQLDTAAAAGKELARKITQKYSKDENIKVAVIGGYSGESTTALRQEGFLKGFNSYFEANPGYKIELLPIRYGEWLPDKARIPVQQIATANPDLKAVFSMSDVMHAGIEQGLKEAGILDKVIIVSYDGAMALAKKMIDEPNGPLQATVSNSPFLQGATAVQMVLDAIKGNKSSCPGGAKYTENVLITPENAKQFYDPNISYYYSKEALSKLQ